MPRGRVSNCARCSHRANLHEHTIPGGAKGHYCDECCIERDLIVYGIEDGVRARLMPVEEESAHGL